MSDTNAIAIDAIESAREDVLAHIAANPGFSASDAIALLMERISLAGNVHHHHVAEDTPIDYVAVMSVEDSISPDGNYIYCLVDGARLKMLRRYLQRFNFTPETYRAHFGLPADYPMTAPGYSQQKRGEAIAVGLGTHENKAGRKAVDMPVHARQELVDA